MQNQEPYGQAPGLSSSPEPSGAELGKLNNSVYPTCVCGGGLLKSECQRHAHTWVSVGVFREIKVPMPHINDPCAMLEQWRSRPLTAHFRAFACVCCRRIWEHLTPPLRHGVEVAEQYLAGSVDDQLRKCVAEDVKAECISIDSDSSASDRCSGFAAEAVLSCLFGDDDYPPIPTYGTNCAMAASRAVIEVVYAVSERNGCSEDTCREIVCRERDWQCKIIAELFGNES